MDKPLMSSKLMKVWNMRENVQRKEVLRTVLVFCVSLVEFCFFQWLVYRRSVKAIHRDQFCLHLLISEPTWYGLRIRPRSDAGPTAHSGSKGIASVRPRKVLSLKTFPQPNVPVTIWPRVGTARTHKIKFNFIFKNWWFFFIFDIILSMIVFDKIVIKFSVLCAIIPQGAMVSHVSSLLSLAVLFIESHLQEFRKRSLYRLYKLYSIEIMNVQK